MKLSAVALLNYQNTNNFAYANQWVIQSGDGVTLYFQVVDLDQGPYNVIGGYYNYSFGFGPVTQTLTGSTGNRYMVGVGSSNQPDAIRVTFPSIDSANVIQVFATQADPNDSSIWSINLSPTQIPATGNVQFTIYEGNNVRNFSVMDMLDVVSLNNGSC